MRDPISTHRFAQKRTRPDRVKTPDPSAEATNFEQHTRTRENTKVSQSSGQHKFDTSAQIRNTGSNPVSSALGPGILLRTLRSKRVRVSSTPFETCPLFRTPCSKRLSCFERPVRHVVLFRTPCSKQCGWQQSFERPGSKRWNC